MPTYLPGKFARLNVTNPIYGSGSAAGPFRWSPGFRRERLDTTNFESVLSADGYNVHSEGQTGPLDTVFSVEGWMTVEIINLFWPAPPLSCDLLFRKNVALGYKGVIADVLDFGPSTGVRENGKFTAQLQANGLVSPAG